MTSNHTWISSFPQNFVISSLQLLFCSSRLLLLSISISLFYFPSCSVTVDAPAFQLYSLAYSNLTQSALYASTSKIFPLFLPTTLRSVLYSNSCLVIPLSEPWKWCVDYMLSSHRKELSYHFSLPWVFHKFLPSRAYYTSDFFLAVSFCTEYFSKLIETIFTLNFTKYSFRMNRRSSESDGSKHKGPAWVTWRH